MKFPTSFLFGLGYIYNSCLKAWSTISQYIHLPNHHLVYLQLTHCCSSATSLKSWKKLYPKKKSATHENWYRFLVFSFSEFGMILGSTRMPRPHEITLNNKVRALLSFQISWLSREHQLGARVILPLCYLLINIFNR